MSDPIRIEEAFERRDANCPEGHVIHQIRMPSGSWVPEDCPECAGVEPKERGPDGPRSFDGDILTALDDAGVNVRKYKDATLDSFDPSNDPQALAAARHYVEAWKTTRDTRYASRDWMYLYGAGSKADDRGRVTSIGRLGNGKTFLAVAIMRALVERGLASPARVRFRTAETLLLEAEATFRDGSTQSEIDLMRKYARPDLLVIDDLGVRHEPSAHAMRIFDEMTKRREANGTIWTSNLSIGVIAKVDPAMGRVADRIAGEAGDGARYVVSFSGPSRRKQRTLR